MCQFAFLWHCEIRCHSRNQDRLLESTLLVRERDVQLFDRPPSGFFLLFLYIFYICAGRSFALWEKSTEPLAITQEVIGHWVESSWQIRGKIRP